MRSTAPQLFLCPPSGLPGHACVGWGPISGRHYPRVSGHWHLLPFPQGVPPPNSVNQAPSLHTQLCARRSGPLPWVPGVTGPLTWLAHALLDTLQARGDQGAGLLGKAAVTLLGQLPEAGAGPRAGSDLHADRHFLKAVSETEVVTDGILPAFRSRPEKGEMLSVDREEWSGRAQFLGERPCLETPVLPQGPGAPAPLSRGGEWQAGLKDQLFADGTHGKTRPGVLLVQTLIF